MRTLDFFERELTKFFAVCSFIFLSVAAFAPVVGDYCPYLQQWHNISLGIDPWVDNQFQALHHIPWYSFCGHFYVSAPNAYGPLFNIYGLTSLIFPTIPRGHRLRSISHHCLEDRDKGSGASGSRFDGAYLALCRGSSEISYPFRW